MKQDNSSGPLERIGGKIDDFSGPRLFEDAALIDTALTGDDRFKLSLPFAKITPVVGAGDSSSNVAETARLASLLRADGAEDSADIAANERIQNPTPTIYLPGNKQRQSRSILTIVLSIISTLVLVAVGIIFAVKSQAATPERTAFETYSLRQLSVAKADRALTATFDAIITAKADAESFNVAVASGLAAVAGAADEPTRLDAEAQRVAFATTVAGIVVADPAELPIDAPDVSSESSLAELAAGLDELSEEEARIETAQKALDAASVVITDARETFSAALTTFVDTIPGSAAAITGANPDAEPQWRDAVTTAAAAVPPAVERGSGAAELQAYAAAVLALQGENARVLSVQDTDQVDEESTPPRAPARPRGGSAPDAGPHSGGDGFPDQGDSGQEENNNDGQSPIDPAPETPPSQSPEADPESNPQG